MKTRHIRNEILKDDKRLLYETLLCLMAGPILWVLIMVIIYFADVIDTWANSLLK